MPTITIGIDLAKSAFSSCELDAGGRVLQRRDLATRLPFGKVLVAIANKHARQAWAMLARDEDYDPHAWLKHPMVQRPASKRRHPAATAVAT